MHLDRFRIGKSGVTGVEKSVAGKRVFVSVETVRIDRSSDPFPTVNWGTDYVSIVEALDIKVDGASVFVPRSVVADLANPRQTLIDFEEREFVQTITGGDGAESYGMRARFNATNVRRRVVYSSLIPKHIAEDARLKIGSAEGRVITNL